MNKTDLQQVIEVVNAQIQRVLHGYSKIQKTMTAFELECMGQYTGDGQTISHITFREFLRRLNLFKDQYTEKTVEIIQNLNNLDLTNIFDTKAALNTYYQAALEQYRQDMLEYESAIASNPDSNLQVPTSGIHTDYLYIVLHDESTDGLLNLYRFDGEQLVNITQDVKPHKHFCLYYPDSEQKFLEGDDEGNIFFYDEQGNLTGDYNYTESGKWSFNILEEDNTRDGVKYVEPAARDADVERIFADKIINDIVIGDDEKPEEEEVEPVEGEDEVVYPLGVISDAEESWSRYNGVSLYNAYSINTSVDRDYPAKMYRGDVFLSDDDEHYKYIGSAFVRSAVTDLSSGSNVTTYRIRVFHFWCLGSEEIADTIHAYDMGSMSAVTMNNLVYYSAEHSFSDELESIGNWYLVRNLSDNNIYMSQRIDGVQYYLKLSSSYSTSEAQGADYVSVLDLTYSRSGWYSTALPDGMSVGETCYDAKTRVVVQYKGKVVSSGVRYYWDKFVGLSEVERE